MVMAIGEQRERRVVVVVRRAAEVAVLREDDVRSELHGRGVVDLDAIAGGDVVGAARFHGAQTREAG